MAYIALCNTFEDERKESYFCIALRSNEDLMAADTLSRPLGFVMRDVEPGWKIRRFHRFVLDHPVAIVLPHKPSGWTVVQPILSIHLVSIRPSSELHAVLKRINARASQIRTFVGRGLPVPDPKPWFSSLLVQPESIRERHRRTKRDRLDLPVTAQA